MLTGYLIIVCTFRLSESIHELENFRKLMDEDAGGGGGISFR